MEGKLDRCLKLFAKQIAPKGVSFEYSAFLHFRGAMFQGGEFALQAD